MSDSQSLKGVSSTKQQAGSQLLSKSSWDPDSGHLPGGSQTEISSPEETHDTPETVLPLHTKKTKRLGQGRR